MEIVFVIVGIIFLFLTVMMCYQESRRRKVSFIAALAICIVLSPIIGYFILYTFPVRNPRGCPWCGNAANEAEFCGLCGKNAEGLTREELASKA